MADEVEDPRAPGWKHDPTRRFLGRYWDGTGWTEHVVGQDRSTSIDPVPVHPERPATSRSSTTPYAQSGQPFPRWAKIGLAVLVFWVLFVVFNGEDKAPPPATATATSQAVALVPGPPSLHVLGGTVRTGAFDITVHGYTDPQAPGRFPPAPGKHFLSVDVEVANRTSASQRFSFLLGFHVIDQAGREIDAMFSDLTPPVPDGDVSPGQSLRGRVLFEVPDGATGLRFRAQGSLDESGGLFPLR